MWRQQDRWRGNAGQRLYTAAWREQSTLYLRRHPVCVVCGGVATVVDHRAPHKGDYNVFWDRTNWQSMCKPDHDRKTAMEDGGFGNPVVRDRYAVDSGPSPLDNLFGLPDDTSKQD